MAEIEERLEQAGGDRVAAAARGRAGAAMMAGLSWQRHMDQLADFVRRFIGADA